MRHLLLIILIIILSLSYKPYDLTPNIYMKIFNDLKRTTSDHVSRKFYCLDKFSKKYNVDIEELYKLIKRESWWDQNEYNKKSGARGLGQVVPFHWDFKLYYLDDGKLGAHIRDNNIKNTKRYYHRIGYGIELCASIYSGLINDFKGHKGLALELYGGFRRKKKVEELRDEYIYYILLSTNYNFLNLEVPTNYDFRKSI